MLHGQYDWNGDPALNSQHFDWDIACDSESWRHSHNVVHHSYTNILGKDRDLGYSLLRITPEQRWKPRHLLQPLANLLLALGFQYGVGSHDLELGRYRHGALAKPVFMERWRRFKAKVGRQWFKDYLLFPALALWSAPRVLAGNLLGFSLPVWLEPTVTRIGAASLALGLMAAGAGMQFGSLASAWEI